MSEITKYNGRFSAEKMKIIREICVPSNATAAQVGVLLDLCARYGLDPLQKELQLVPFAGKMQVICGQDGYMRIASRHKDFGGIRAGVIHEGQPYEIDYEKGIVMTKQPWEFQDKPIWGAWACAFRKGRVPTIELVKMSEYKKNTPVWRTYPGEMLKKVARVRALKFSFEITGLVTQEEMGIDDTAHGPEKAVNVTPKPKAKKAKATKKIDAEVITPEAEAFPEEIFISMGKTIYKKIGGESFRRLVFETVQKEIVDIRKLDIEDKKKLFEVLEVMVSG